MLTNGLKSFWENFFFGPNSKKILLKIRLSIRVRNFAAPNEPLNIKNFYFNPKDAPPPPIETLWCKNHQNPSYRKSHTWAPLMYPLPAGSGEAGGWGWSQSNKGEVCYSFLYTLILR